MRILQINNHEALGGGSERVYQLTSRLLLDRGHEVATLACGQETFDSRKHSVLLAPNGYLQRNLWQTLRNIRDFVHRDEAARAVQELVRSFRPDLAHLHIFYGQLSNAVLQTLHTLGVPCVMTVHEYRMLCPVSTLHTERLGICERCADGQLRHAMLNRCNRNSLASSAMSVLEASYRDRHAPYARCIDHFFMVSRFCLDKHIEHIPALSGKSSVLYNFLPAQDFASEVAPRSSAAPYLYAGRLSHEKGVGLLCEAFAQRPNLQLRIAGSGPKDAELRLRYAALANVQFLGRLDTSALKQEIAAARFCVTPSEWYENNPMAILESFAAGTPVVGARIGGIPELVVDGQTGFLFEPSQLSSLLHALDKSSATSPSEHGCQARSALDTARARHHEAPHYQQLMQVYERVLERKHAPRVLA